MLGQSIDPIVFVFSGYYCVNLPRKDGETTIDPGNTFALNPSLAFAVNDRVTLSILDALVEYVAAAPGNPKGKQASIPGNQYRFTAWGGLRLFR